MPHLVPQILSFGAIGLAFLMAFLAFRLVNAVASNPEPAPATIKLIRFYMVMALILLCVGCVLQVYIQDPPVTVNLIITPELEEEIHPVGFFNEEEELIDLVFDGQRATLDLHKGSQITLKLDSIMRRLRMLETIKRASLSQQASESAEIGPADEI